jgi:hypothetical protein
MSKKLLFISMIFNIILASLVGLFFQSNNLVSNSRKFIDQRRIEDLQILEKLIIGRISKEETLIILKKHFKEDVFFDKPTENGVGAGTMFLVFDKNNLLSEVKTNSFDGP